MGKTQEQRNEDKIKKLEFLEKDAMIAEEEELFYDFDKAIKEKGIKPLKVKFNNIIFDIPAEMPFDFSMFFFRKCMFKDDHGKQIFDVKEEDIVEFITLMFGNAFLDVLETSKISIRQIFDDLALNILTKWGYGIQTAAKGENVQKKI